MGGGLVGWIDAATRIVNNTLIPLAFSLCILYFFWGIVKYIKDSAGTDKAREEAKRTMLYGLLGIFVAFSIWGIVKFLQTELEVPAVQNIEKPVIGVGSAGDPNWIGPVE